MRLSHGVQGAHGPVTAEVEHPGHARAEQVGADENQGLASLPGLRGGAGRGLRGRGRAR